MMMPLFKDGTKLLEEMAQLNRQVTSGLAHLSKWSEADVEIGTAPKKAVFQEDHVVLYHYEPVVERPHPVPLLVCYALVNRPYMADLQPDRSLIRNLLKLGLDIYLIDWGYPQRGDRWLTLDDYINGYISDCVDFICGARQLPQINILGICQGGTFSLCYTALHPERVRNLITMVAPVDFDVEEGLLNLWSGCKGGEPRMDVDLMVDALGNIPGDFMNFGFLMLKPFQLNLDKYIHLTSQLDNEAKLMEFLRMEKWIFDSPDQAGDAFRQFMKDFFQENKLVKGEVVLGGQRVDLANITMPVLNVHAEVDHLVPPASSRALEKYVGSQDYTVKAFPAGHIGMYVSGKVQASLPPTIADWLKTR